MINQNKKEEESEKNVCYVNKNTRQIGVVVHKGITTTLRFEDESELTISPARLRDDWKLVNDNMNEGDKKRQLKKGKNKI